jgi:hypothetical protein
VAEKSLYLASAMCDPKNEDIVGFEAVDDNVFTHGEAAAPEAEIFIPGTPHVWEAGKQNETVCDGVNQAVCNLDAAAFLCDVKPDVVKIKLGPWRYTMRH